MRRGLVKEIKRQDEALAAATEALVHAALAVEGRIAARIAAGDILLFKCGDLTDAVAAYRKAKGEGT